MWGTENWSEMIWSGLVVTPVPSLHWSMLIVMALCFLAGGYFLNPMHRTRHNLLVFAVLLSIPATTVAITLPHAFVNGTIADADEVNANFGALETAINSAPSAVGEIQIDNGVPIPYAISLDRYIVEATPAQVGTVVPLDVVRVNALCRNVDGCGVEGRE